MPFPFAAALGAIGSIAGGLLGKSGQESANRTNLQIWREQQKWEEELSNTSVYRRMADLKRSGINPMLAAMDGASTPATGMPTMENENEEMSKGVASAAQAALVAQEIKNARAQAQAAVSNAASTQQVSAAQARKLNAEAAITESAVPYSGVTSGLEAFKLKREVQYLGQQMDKLVEDTSISMNEAELQRRVMGYREEIQKYAAESARLGISEQQAIAALYEHFKGAKGAERFMPMILELFRSARK